MNILLFYIKELYYKLIILLVVSITLLLITASKIKYLFLFILSPLKQIKITNYLIEYNIENINNIDIIQKISTFIPIIEINLPFFTTSYIYIKYILLFFIYFAIPIIVYFIYISISPILKKTEHTYFKYICIYICVYILINFIVNHYIIIPIFIKFIYLHYNEIDTYEFDVEFQIVNYLDLYFRLLFLNIIVFIIIEIKKHLHITYINYITIIFILLTLVPIDLITQLIYITLINIIFVTNKINENYINGIKKYKQMGYLEKN